MCYALSLYAETKEYRGSLSHFECEGRQAMAGLASLAPPISTICKANTADVILNNDPDGKKIPFPPVCFLSLS